MNSSKLAFANIRKCARDYMVYYVTLVIGVMVFYVFNSLGDQTLIASLSESGAEIVKMMLSLIEGVSLGVAFVLGFLIVYANNFLLRRRKKEFGVYLMLGMTKSKVAGMLLRETFYVGLISLVSGLLCGIFGSQLLSILVGKLFEADLSMYRFSFSIRAAIMTVVNFFAIFGVVFLLNTFSLAKIRLVNLLSAEKQGEKRKFRKTWPAVILFVASVLVLLNCYYRIGLCFDDVYRNELVRILLLGVICTFTFFWSLGGFFQQVLGRFKGFYFRGLNSFVIRSFTKSINSSSLMMGLICLMLFGSTVMFSAGFTVNRALTRGIRERTPVDICIECDSATVTDYFAEKGMPADTWMKEGYEVVFEYGSADIAMIDTFGKTAEALREQFPLARWNEAQNLMTMTDYNRVAKLYGKEPIELQPDQYAVVCDFTVLKEMINNAMEDGNTLHLGDFDLTPARPDCIDSFIMMSGSETNLGVIVIHDSVFATVHDLRQTGSFLIGDLKDRTKEGMSRTEKQLKNLAGDELNFRMDPNTGGTLPPFVYISSRQDIIDSNNGLAISVTFLVFYLGIVMIIFCAAILALKVMAECVDSVSAYDVLRKTGANGKMRARALFAQVGMYFALPLLVSAVHSAVGLTVVKQVLFMVDMDGVFSGVVGSAIVLLILYGGYMVGTYSAGKKMIHAGRD